MAFLFVRRKKNIAYDGEPNTERMLMNTEDRALIGLCAAMLGTGFVIGRKNKKKTAMRQWERQTDVIHLQRELFNFAVHAKRDNPNMTYAEWRDGINERIDFLNIISKA